MILRSSLSLHYRRFTAFAITGCCIAALVLLQACLSQRRASNLYHNAAIKHESFDAIIVPGLAFKNRNWGSLMKRRVIWSWRLYENGIAKNIIYSGAAVYTPYKEALVMGLYAKKLGIPGSHIHYDTLAQHSTENVYYSYLIAKQHGYKTIALCTDRYQSTFLKRFIRRRFVSTIHLLPVIKDTTSKYDFKEPAISLLNARVRDTANFRSIRQRESLFYRIKGTLGKNIPWGIHHNRKVERL